MSGADEWDCFQWEWANSFFIWMGAKVQGLEPWNGPSVDGNLNRLGIFNGILTRLSLFDFVAGDIRGWWIGV